MSPKPPGESLLPYRWSINKKTDRNPKKVNSLIYKDYVMVEQEDGSKLYVSPEEKAQLIVEGKIKAERTKSLEKQKLKLKLSDSDSEEGYETPVVPPKPKSCENLDICVRPEIKRNSSFPEVSSNEYGKINLPPFIVPVETSLSYSMTKRKNREKRKTIEIGNEMVPYITSQTETNGLKITHFPYQQNDIDIKKRYSLRPSMYLWPRSKNQENIYENGKPKNRFSLPWRTSKDQKEEEWPRENRKEKKSFSIKLPKLSWKGKKDKMGYDEPDDVNNQGESEKEIEANEDEPFKRKDVYRDRDENDNEEVAVVVEEPREIFPTHEVKSLTGAPFDKEDEVYQFWHGEKYKKRDDDNIKTPADSVEEASSTKRPIPLSSEKMSTSEESLAEIYKRESEPDATSLPQTPNWSTFPSNDKIDDLSKSEESLADERRPPKSPDWSTFPLNNKKLNDVSKSEESLMEPDRKESEAEEEKLPAPPDWSTFPLSLGIKTVDRNPLTDYFKNKSLPSDDEEPIRISIVDDRTGRAKNPNDFSRLSQQPKPLKKIDRNPLKNIFSHKKKRETKNLNDDEDDKGNLEVDPFGFGNNHPSDTKTKYGGSGEIIKDADTASNVTGSDTESADHGSADKSSMSKLTSDKPPKKLMGNIFGSFKIGKSKDKVADNEPNKNPPSFEITIKDQLDDIPAEVPRSERIVYAELDMARSPGNVMRRDDEKTEYAEIIYPGSKSPTERAMEELRKSRENLALSHEDLTEVDEAYTTVITPDGKKEAAV